MVLTSPSASYRLWLYLGSELTLKTKGSLPAWPVAGLIWRNLPSENYKEMVVRRTSWNCHQEHTLVTLLNLILFLDNLQCKD